MNETDLLSELQALQSGAAKDVDWRVFALLLAVSLLASLYITWLHRKFAMSRDSGSEIQRAFPLLAVAVTAIFLAIQFSLPLSLGLLGALSIVRFRTPIKQPEEIGFLMLVIASALCCATFHLSFLSGLLLVATIGLAVRRVSRPLFPTRGEGASVLLSLGAEQYQGQGREVMAYLESRLNRLELEGVSSRDGEVVLTMSFRGGKGFDAVALEQGLRAITEPRSLSILLAPASLP